VQTPSPERPTTVVAAPAEVALPAGYAEPDLRLELHGDRRNLTLGLEALAVGPQTPTALLDLLEIAAAIYATDGALPRGRNERWTRDWRLLIAVREPTLWRQQSPALHFLVYFLTRDRVRLDFAPAELPPPAARPAEPPEADCVALLSGGLDSLAGAVALLRTGRRPWLISVHTGNPTVEAAQRSARAALARLAERPLPHATLTFQPSRVSQPRFPFPPLEEREPSQRARSLLFLAAATAAAHALGVPEVYVFENGLLAAHVPLTAARVGSFSTRTTHPVLFEAFEKLVRETVGQPVRLQNPFLHQTKTQIVRDILRPALTAEEIQATVSCWQAGRAVRPCGTCVPCLLRQFALLGTGLTAEAHMTELLADPRAHRGSDGFVNLMDLLLFAVDFATHDDADLMARRPDLLDAPDPAATIDTCRRHAREMLHLVRAQLPAVAEFLPPDVGG